MKVLFVCTANSCRSQMAEAWAGKLFPQGWQAQSAGLLTYRITEKTRAVMTEIGLDMAGQKPKTFDKVDLDSFDLIITLSKEAGLYLPIPGDSDRHRRCPVDDPMSFSGTPEETRTDFRRGRDEIRDIVQGLVADG